VLALVNKDYIEWKRDYKRSVLEIMLPVLVFITISVIRTQIPINIMGATQINNSILLGPFPNSARMGLSDNSS
jgi:hypothetical protein